MTRILTLIYFSATKIDSGVVKDTIFSFR